MQGFASAGFRVAAKLATAASCAGGPRYPCHEPLRPVPDAGLGLARPRRDRSRADLDGELLCACPPRAPTEHHGNPPTDRPFANYPRDQLDDGRGLIRPVAARHQAARGTGRLADAAINARGGADRGRAAAWALHKDDLCKARVVPRQDARLRGDGGGARAGGAWTAAPGVDGAVGSVFAVDTSATR